MSTLKKQLTVGVIGPAGFGGSYLCMELINRGHKVVGISRNPQKLGSHTLYTPRPGNVAELSIEGLAETFRGVDVLVNEYGPHSAGVEALKYMPFLEVTRRIILAAKIAKINYFIMVGGCGSLYMPNSGYQSVLENKGWWLSYRRGIADSEAHTRYMEERLGPMGDSLRAYRNARAAKKTGNNSAEVAKLIEDYELQVLRNDRALEFITACRTSFMFFDGNTSFRWTFVSPSALYRAGKRTGTYETQFDYIPLKGDPQDPNNLDGRLHGISAADLGIAIADEAEKQSRVGRHWTAFADLSDDTHTPSYVTLDQVQAL